MPPSERGGAEGTQRFITEANLEPMDSDVDFDDVRQTSRGMGSELEASSSGSFPKPAPSIESLLRKAEASSIKARGIEDSPPIFASFSRRRSQSSEEEEEEQYSFESHESVSDKVVLGRKISKSTGENEAIVSEIYECFWEILHKVSVDEMSPLMITS